MKISSNKKYLDDVKRYSIAISKIKDSSIQRKYKSILADFQTQIELIDTAHSSLQLDPVGVRPSVEKSVQLRQELDTMCDDVLNNT